MDIKALILVLLMYYKELYQYFVSVAMMAILHVCSKAIIAPLQKVLVWKLLYIKTCIKSNHVPH